MTSPDRDLRIMFFGDSFVAGTGDPEARGWVGRVLAATWAAGTPLTGYALGIRRQTSIQVFARWRTEAGPRLLAGADCRIVVSFGSNDATLEDGEPLVEPEVSERVLEQLLDDAARMGLAAFVVGPPPSGDPRQDARIAALSEAFAEICAARRVPFVAVVGALRASAVWGAEACAGDGVHPAAGGYDELAALVLAGGWLDWLA